jgi:two-component system chemotaxis response regulator CheB
MTGRKIRVLIADDSALMRQVLRKLVESAPDLEVVATARDGEDAVAKARDLKPDVLTLDINMPKLDGLSALQLILQEQICPVIMVSSLTQEGAATTFEALELGAFDVVGKPGGTVSADMQSVAAELTGKIRAAAATGTTARVRRRPVPTPARRTGGARPAAGSAFRAVALGISTGGPSTLMRILPMIPREVNAALFITQHMPAAFITTFAKRLAGACPLAVLEAESGLVVEPGHCYVARGGCHLGLFRKGNGQVVVRTPAQPVTQFMPGVNPMMESVLAAYGPATIGVLMTGIGDDGADGMVKIRKAGGRTIAESEASAIVYGMPREAFERGGAEVVVPDVQVPAAILRMLDEGVRRAA